MKRVYVVNIILTIFGLLFYYRELFHIARDLDMIHVKVVVTVLRVETWLSDDVLTVHSNIFLYLGIILIIYNLYYYFKGASISDKANF